MALNDWTEVMGGGEEKWMRLVRFEIEIGLNSAIEVQSEAFFSLLTVSICGWKKLGVCHVSKG